MRDVPLDDLEDRHWPILEAMTDLVVVKGPESRILWANRAFREFYAMTNEELRVCGAALGTGNASVFSTGKSASEEHVTKIDGRVTVFHTVTSAVLDASANVAMTVAVSRDITDRKRIELASNVASRMVSAGTLAAGVAHEINNPLMYVMMNVEHVRSELAQKQSFSESERVELRVALDEVKEGAERVRSVVNDLQTFCRSDDDRRQLVDLHRVIDRSAKLARHEIRPRARFESDLGDVPLVEGNEAQLGQVLLNLLLNAAQAMGEGDAAENELRIVTALTNDGMVSIEVRDTGRGIANEDLPRIFDPFFTTKSVGGGTGLGLSIAHNIVAAHGGRIEVESSPGKGTVFRVLLTPAPFESVSQSSRTIPPRSRRGARLPERSPPP